MRDEVLEEEGEGRTRRVCEETKKEKKQTKTQTQTRMHATNCMF
jgi:hypothetical protein